MRRIIFSIILVSLVLSCGEKNPVNTSDRTGTAVINATTAPAKIAKIGELKPTTRAEISFLDSASKLITKKSLTISNKRVSGSVKVRAGSGYTAELFCYDKDNNVTHSGTASNISIITGQQTTITILLIPAAPEAPVATGPQTSVISGHAYTISWDSVSRAKSYTSEEASDSTFTNPESETIVGLSDSETKNTEETVTYYYRIKAHNSTGSSDWSNVVVVVIEPATLTMAVNQSGWGTTTPSIGSYAYDEGSVVDITAMPAAGYQFVNWTGDVADADSSSTTVTMTGNQSVTANFEEITLLDITMLAIPSGSFRMGDISGTGNSDERPVHTVTVSSFEMSAQEITQEQYAEAMGENSSNFSGTNLPVEMVTWYNAVQFCNALSEEEGLTPCYDESTWECDFSANGYRLPTETEWEYACRAGTETKYYTGDSESDCADAGWYAGNSSYTTHPVGQKTPNAWGLYDMHGNVFEWCHDWYDSGYYSSSPSADPTGPTSGSFRVRRGGSMTNNKLGCTSSYRLQAFPSDTFNDLGFRVVSGAFTPGTITYSISGTVTGADGVTVTLGGDTTGSQTVNDGGTYSFTANEGCNYTITPSKDGYTFTPASQTFDNVTSNMAQNFTASQVIVPTEITMVAILGGNFSMGDISGTGESNELPVHMVTISSFEIGAYEITQEQYEAAMGENPSNFSGTNLPVEMVTWYNAVQFCNALSEEEGLTPCYDESTWECDFSADGFRLPTEAEWEYACRAGTETEYYTGNYESDCADAGWYNGNSGSKTHPVGQKTPNTWGLYDMHGNMWEWCHDWYDSGYYSSSPSADPTGPTSGSYRVNRGGCWGNSAGFSRSAYRYRHYPSTMASYVGFRVVRGAFTPGTKTYTISGTISGADDVTVTLGGDTTGSQTVNDGGTYSFTVNHGGNYTVTPSKDGYTFTPASQTFDNVLADQTQDFTAFQIITAEGKIVFNSDRDENLQIYIMDADGSNQTRITHNHHYDFGPSWSPDGSRIAFGSDRDGNFATANEIYIMDADGSNQTRLTNNPANDNTPCWSPDGFSIAFVSNFQTIGGHIDIFIMDADGSNQRNITNVAIDDFSPSWSPDSSQIVFDSRRGSNSEIYVMNVDGSNLINLTNNSAVDRDPSWSPDGSHIAFYSDRDGNIEIYVMDADGSNQTRLTNNPAIDYGPCWSPDSSYIAFYSYRDGISEIYVMNADGSNLTRLTNNPANDYAPSWSPF